MKTRDRKGTTAFSLIMTMEVLGASTVALKTTYKATDDFIFESTLRPDILYNPSYLQVIKKLISVHLIGQ